MKLQAVIYTTIIAIMCASCSESNCVLGREVATHVSFIGSVSKKNLACQGPASLFICRQDAGDTVVLNKYKNLSMFTLPLNSAATSDTYIIEYDTTLRIRDTFTIRYQNRPTFESLECGTTMFHTLLEITGTNHGMDSIVIARKDVNYYEDANIKIYIPNN